MTLLIAYLLMWHMGVHGAFYPFVFILWILHLVALSD